MIIKSSMRKKDYFLLFVLGLCVTGLVASYQSSPGYMDADYYYAGGLQLATGHGFTEPYIWNFLNDPTQLPVPSHTYWMPFASILASLGMAILRINQYVAARAGFILLTGCVSPLTAALAYSLNPNRKMAYFAGLLAILPGFYLPFLPTTDTFGIQMVLGGLFFLAILKMTPSRNPFWLGLIAGLMHLSRADGILWLFIALTYVSIYHEPLVSGTKNRILLYGSRIGLCFLGYFLIMSPWFLRNYESFGAIFPPGGVRGLWLTNYDEIYSYPATILTPTHWLASGIKSILIDRLSALSQNIQTTVAVQTEIFLFPFLLIGIWRLRKEIVIKIGIDAYLLIFVLMTVIFPYAGARGGFFHSGSALQILFWALVPLGLQVIISFGSRLRGWSMSQAFNVLGAGLIGIALLFTVFTTYPKLFGWNTVAAWGKSESVYPILEKELVALNADPHDVVLVNNPPGYFISTGRTAVAIPDGNVASLHLAAQKFNARFLLLEPNHPQALDNLYNNPKNQAGLNYLRSTQDTRIFMIIE